jgi:threonine dehydrogenase-like Zn-dependent dehydrogenase
MSVQEVDFPRSLRVGEVLLEVECAGVCGTDLAIWGGEYAVPLPLVLGHEFVARVADVPGRSDFRSLIGKRVVCEINNTCMAYGKRSLCGACRSNLPSHCLRRTVTGIVAHPGAFAQYLCVPARNLHVLPPTIPSAAGVLVEPLAAAIRTFELTPLSAGQTVVVLGCGRLGLLVALVAHKAGARVVTVSRTRSNLDRAKSFSWKQIQNDASGDRLRDKILDLTRGLGADIVVEATGNNRNLQAAQRLVRPQGTVAMKSTSGVAADGLDTTFAAVQEIRLQGSRCGPFRKAIRFMLKHGLPDESWITARFPLSEIRQAFQAASHEPKVLVEMDRPDQ